MGFPSPSSDRGRGPGPPLRRGAPAALLALALSAVLVAACGHGGPRPGDPGHGGVHAADERDRRHDFSGAERWAERFDDPDRDAWQKPDRLLDRLELAPDDVVADVGAGTGYLAVRLAERVPQGRVWGSDLEPDMVRYLNARARRAGHVNLFGVLALPDDPLLPEPVDLLLLVDTYHHLSERSAYFERAARYLAPGGRVAIVDFKPGDLPVGPPDRLKLAASEVTQELRAAGYERVDADQELLPYQYLLVFQRRP